MPAQVIIVSDSWDVEATISLQVVDEGSTVRFHWTVYLYSLPSRRWTMISAADFEVSEVPEDGRAVVVVVDVAGDDGVAADAGSAAEAGEGGEVVPGDVLGAFGVLHLGGAVGVGGDDAHGHGRVDADGGDEEVVAFGAGHGSIGIGAGDALLRLTIGEVFAGELLVDGVRAACRRCGRWE